MHIGFFKFRILNLIFGFWSHDAH